MSSFGNANDTGNKGLNTPYQRAQLRLLVEMRNLARSGGAYTTNDQTITGTTMTLPQTPVFIYGIYLNGQKLTVGDDYTVSGNVITFLSALSGDLVSAVYTF